jgi:hypothetical protein
MSVDLGGGDQAAVVGETAAFSDSSTYFMTSGGFVFGGVRRCRDLLAVREDCYRGRVYRAGVR